MDDGRGDRGARARTRGAQSKLSLMHLFRAAHAAGDFRPKGAQVAEGEPRQRQYRHGIDEDTLREHLRLDLQTLLNTISLDSIVPLDAEPHLRRSIINYGVVDLSDQTEQGILSPAVIQRLRDSLLAYEPRLVPETLEITATPGGADSNRCLHLHLSAELVSDPVDFSLEVEAQLDAGAGKLHLSRLSLQS